MLSNVNVGKNLNGSITMRGSNSNGKMESSSSIEKELELLLLQQQQQNRGMFVERETDLNINRSGSAPPTVDGALRAAGSLFKNPSFEKFDSSANVGFMTDEEIRSHPAYLEYYYSNENHNPRLPPPLLSKEDWRLAQRVRAAGFGTIGDWLNRVSMDNDRSSSLFSMQPGLSVKKAEDEMLELRKAALRNISRKNSSELLNKGSIGLVGSSSSGMGVRRKSFADILQEGLGEPAKSQLSRPASQNSLGDVSYSTATSSANAAEIRNASESLGLPSSQNVGAKLSSSFASSVPSSGATSVPSSSIFELADIADSLSGLNMSQDQRHKLNQQQHYFETMKADKLVNNVDYAYLTRNNGSTLGRNVSNSLMNDGISFPRRTSSTTNLQTLLNPSNFGSQENLKILCQGSNFPGVGVSGHGYGGYAVNNNLTAGAAGVGHNLRSNNLLGMSSPAMASDQFQYFHVPGNSSQYIGGSPSREDFLALQKAYLEALHVQQKQHYLSQVLNIPPGFGPSAASNKGHMSMSSLHSTNVSPTCQNEKCSQFSSALRSMKEDATDCLHSQNENNMKGKFESLLEVSKNNKTKSLELSDVLSHVVEFSTDQNGSRFIQQKLETANLEEKMKIFAEIIPHARSLMIDVFGNYVIQKFLEHGTEDQREEIARNLIGHVLPLTLQMYGCRVIQKALEVVDVELQTQMVSELDGSVMKCVRDQNGNHVIQKCIECIPQDRIEFIISSFLGQVVALSTHPYGCRVIQRVLEHCVDPKTQKLIMDEIMSSVCNLAQDQYGNYVLQHVLQHGKPHERSAIISKLAGQIVKMSQQKFASNVIEKCLTFGGPEERKLVVNEMLGSTDENEPLQAMMKDPFGNYVVQKVLDTCDDRSRELILSRIKVHLASLKRYTYGKHIVSRVEKLIANGEKRGELSSPSSS